MYFSKFKIHYILQKFISKIITINSFLLGRKRGEYLDRLLTDDLFFEQTMANTVRRRVKPKEQSSNINGSEALAADDFES